MSVILGSVSVESYSVFTTNLSDLLDRFNSSDLVIRRHNRYQIDSLHVPNCFLNVLKIYTTKLISLQVERRTEALSGVQQRVMFYMCG